MNQVYHLEIENYWTKTEYTMETSEKLYAAYCGGRACPECHKCRDWYYSATNHIDCEADRRVYRCHLGPLIGPMYRWLRHSDATCGYHAYPHYVHYIAYHGNCIHTNTGCPVCPRRSCDNLHHDQSSSHHHFYPCRAIHGLNICHCDVWNTISSIEANQQE